MYPTPELSQEKRDKRLDQLCATHGIPDGSWDRIINESAHLVLQWIEPNLHLAVIVILSASDFSVEIGRNRYTYGGGTRPVQRVTSIHAYNVPSAELRAVLGEIRVARSQGPKKKEHQALST